MTKIKNAVFSDKNTTAMGVAAILMAVGAALQALFDGDATTHPDWNIIIAGVWGGVMGILAGDGGKD